MYDSYLATQWTLAHLSLHLLPSWREYFTLRNHYTSPTRHYHNWRHVHDTIRFVRTHYGWQPLIVLALFYHDVIYEVSRPGNEVASAGVWRDYADRRGVGVSKKESVETVEELILMTETHTVHPHQGEAFKMMCDADMSILLATRERYLEYAQAIWEEYKSIGREGYRNGRLQFLDGLDVGEMFYTEQAREMVDTARGNWEFERALLRDEPEKVMGDV